MNYNLTPKVADLETLKKRVPSIQFRCGSRYKAEKQGKTCIFAHIWQVPYCHFSLNMLV